MKVQAKHRKNHAFSIIAGLFMVVMLILMIVPLVVVLLRS